MQHSRIPGALGRGAAALLAACAVLVPTPGRAQGQDVSGVVVAATSLEPLAGAQVAVAGTRQGTITGPNGRFTLRGLTGTQVELQVTMLGYRTTSRQATVGDHNVRIEMPLTAVTLDELVVTGTAHAEQKRAIGNVVSTVNAAATLSKAPVQDVNQLLNGHVAGLTVMANTGQVGGGIKVSIRGPSSFSLRRPPLIYVDGVRVDNEDNAGPTLAQDFGSSPISRWNDIDPNDIESIQVIKGPAAATLYGTEASNGVVQIITKRGNQGTPRFHFSMQQGANWFMNPQGRLWTNYGMVNGQLQSIDYSQVEKLWNAYQDSAGIKDPIFKTGHLQSYDLSMSGGGGVVQYFVSGGYTDNNGIERTNRERKGNGRVNVTVTPNERWSLSGNFAYVNGRYDVSCEQGCGGNTWTTYYMTPENIGTPSHGLFSGTPQSYHTLYANWEDLGRFTGSAQVNFTPVKWFTNRVTFGTDQTREGDNTLMNHDERFLYFDDFADRGYRWIQDRNVNYTTLDYSGSVSLDVMPSLKSSTSFGTQYYRKHQDWVVGYGEAFPVPGLTSLSATTQNRTADQDFVNNTTVGVFGQEQFSWLDRRFLTVALRADDNSAFGRNFKLIYYPKVSGAWVLSDEPFFHVPAMNTFRLRAAYGQSGQQPNAFDAIRTYAPVTGPNDVGTITPQNVGNPNLGPERSSELEAGFDAGFLNDRLGLEFTYYDQQTKDAILLKQIAPSTGFSGSEYVNAGKIANHGLELQLRGTPYVAPRATWEVGFNIGQNSNKVVSLGNVTSASFISPATYIRHEIGYPVGSWFGPKVVSATVGADGKAANIMCADGKGGTVDCASAPQVFLGRSTPKLEGGLNTTLTLFRNLRLYGQMDFKTGFSKLNGNERVRCWFYALCLASYEPQKVDPVKVAGYQKRYVSSLIEDAGFAKLREISATYTIPANYAQRFGVQGANLTFSARNLHTWTKYPGLEPEASFNSGTRGTFGQWEQDVIPQLAQFVTTLNVNF